MNAYSRDLREKIVRAVTEHGMQQGKAADTFGVSLSSIKRYVRAAREGRSLAPKKRPGARTKLDERTRRLLDADLKERPFVRLCDRREYLQTVAGVAVSDSTICRELGRMDHTHKKGQ